jgi:hypothetical protein
MRVSDFRYAGGDVDLRAGQALAVVAVPAEVAGDQNRVHVRAVEHRVENDEEVMSCSPVSARSTGLVTPADGGNSFRSALLTAAVNSAPTARRRRQHRTPIPRDRRRRRSHHPVHGWRP